MSFERKQTWFVFSFFLTKQNKTQLIQHAFERPLAVVFWFVTFLSTCKSKFVSFLKLDRYVSSNEKEGFFKCSHTNNKRYFFFFFSFLLYFFFPFLVIFFAVFNLCLTKEAIVNKFFFRHSLSLVEVVKSVTWKEKKKKKRDFSLKVVCACTNKRKKNVCGKRMVRYVVIRNKLQG